MIELLVSIQDSERSPSFSGCWRGMYDVEKRTWNCGDLYEGGSGSIYSGWTNAPISIALLHDYMHESVF